MVGRDAVGLVADGVEVERDAVRRTDLVLAAVALADRAGLVVVDHEFLGKLVVELHRGTGEHVLLGKRQDRGREGGECGGEGQHDAHVVVALLVLADDLLIVGVAQDREHAALHAERRLDDVGDVFDHVLALALAIDHLHAAGVLMLREVVVRAVGNAPELAPAEREEELEVRRCLGVEAQLLGIVVAQAEVLVLQADGEQPVVAERAPVVEPLKVGARLAEEFELHLLELAHAEDEVARRDLVAEGLADLADAERELFARGALDVIEVDEDALRGLGAEVDGVLCVLGHALERLEHEVKLTDIGEVVLAAGGAGDVVLFDKVLHLLLGEGVDGLGKLEAGLGAPVLNDLVGAEALVALAAVHQRIGEAAEMAACHPGLRVHQDRGVKADVVGILLHELLPPGVLDVLLELGAEGAVVPGVGKAAVDLAAGEDKAAVFAQRDDLVHRLFGVFHGEFLLSVLGSGDKKRPEPIKVGSGRTNHCPWFHLNSPLDAGHFVPL